MKRETLFAVALAAFVAGAFPLAAQIPVPPPAPELAPQSPAELDQLLGPIALFPDPLIAQILPAATLPAEVVLAYRYVSGGGDVNWIDQQPWDSSVKALARYPDVLKMMNADLAWTADLGQAFLNQPQDVMNAIQDLRAQAQDLGNLQSSPQLDVVDDDGTVEILPADPDMLYVPIYQPDLVFFQRPYGGRFISFGAGLRIGAWLDHDFDWHGHNILVWDHNHPRPPNWWHERPSQRPRTVLDGAAFWRPAGHAPVAGGNGEDRGWNPRGNHAVYTASPRAAIRPAEPAKPVVIHNNSTPGPGGGRQIEVPHRQENAVPLPVMKPPSNGAFIGAESARETRAASNRGQQSRQINSHPAAAAPRTASPIPSAKKSH